MKKKWYVVYTKSQCEKKVAALLTKKKIENYCPLNRILNCKGNNKKWVHEPLFASLVFVYITDAEIDKVRQLGSVVNFIYWLNKPAIISETEIENIQDFTREYSNIQLEKAAVNPSGIVGFISEPHIDINSNTNLISVKNSHFKLLLPTLGYVMITEVEKSTIDVFNFGFERSKLVS
jgi:transcription antitermination factor NusG